MNKKGFTLLELLIVIAIISILGVLTGDYFVAAISSLSKGSPQKSVRDYCENKLGLQARDFPVECLDYLKNYINENK